MYKIQIDSTKRREKAVILTKNTKNGDKLVAKKEGDIDIVSSIRDILEQNNIKVEEISEIIPNTGPGSFTGIKIGVTIANIFNWALKNKKIEELYIPEYGRSPNVTLKKKFK